MDTYEALLASMNYLVKPTRKLEDPTKSQKAASSEIGRCCFEEVTPQNWSNRPSTLTKEE